MITPFLNFLYTLRIPLKFVFVWNLLYPIHNSIILFFYSKINFSLANFLMHFINLQHFFIMYHFIACLLCFILNAVKLIVWVILVESSTFMIFCDCLKVFIVISYLFYLVIVFSFQYCLYYRLYYCLNFKFSFY